MSNNPIIDDLHATRQKLLEESGGTLAGLIVRLRASQKASGRKILPSLRPDVCAEAAKSDELAVENQASRHGAR
jgi:hypothetical protein